jgi:hypothetical protein
MIGTPGLDLAAIPLDESVRLFNLPSLRTSRSMLTVVRTPFSMAPRRRCTRRR